MLSILDTSRNIWRFCVKRPSIAFSDAIERKRFKSLFSAILPDEDANRQIYDALSRKEPFLAARIGHTEGRIVGEYIFRDCHYSRLTLKEAHQYSGIFPVTKDSLSQFARIYSDAISRVDLLGFWQSAYQAKIVHGLSPKPTLASLRALEPYFHELPWTKALEGKRVMVVHPFTESIASQYAEKRQSLFRNSSILPAFQLLTIKPPQTLAPLTQGFPNWISAYKDLEVKLLESSFDIALIGCGAYGMPLAAAVKASGRQAIHLGGALQLLFGITGRRWESMAGFAGLMNENWVRPSVSETPQAAHKVDDACYW